MYNLYNIYDEHGKLVDVLLATSVQETETCTTLSGVPGENCLTRTSQYPKGFKVVVDNSRKRFLIYCYQEAYVPIGKSKHDDPHQIFATLLGISREEAKERSYEILYRGCQLTAKCETN